MIVLDRVASVPEALRLANRLRLCLKSPFLLNGIEFYVTASVGLAFLPRGEPRTTSEALVRDAERVVRGEGRGA